MDRWKLMEEYRKLKEEYKLAPAFTGEKKKIRVKISKVLKEVHKMERQSRTFISDIFGWIK